MATESPISPDGPLNPTSIPPAQLARMLGVGQSMIDGHVEAGAPTNPDGTISLVHYAAWLNTPGARGAGEGDDGD